MTKAEILKQIEELGKQVENLPEDEKKIRTMPIEGEEFTYIDTLLDFTKNNYPSNFDTYEVDENSSIGNYFKSQDDAKMVIRAMQIEQAIRIRRIELNDGWEPDWDDDWEDGINGKAFLFYEEDNIYIDVTWEYSKFPIFGYHKSREIAEQIIDEFEEELLWYFNEYYPNKDKMYVWGETEND